MGNIIYICKIKIIGTQFAVLNKELADQWVDKDKEMNYYEIVEIRH